MTLATVSPKSRAAWRAWLNAITRAATRSGSAQEAPGKASVSYDEAVEEAICFGWIDGLVKRVDDEPHAAVHAPTKPVWSQ
jgi:uncharacterized protein YdeI (YjbR/CyaY-like superfamily)